MRDRIAELLVKKKWPLLDVTSGAYTEEIEQDVIAGFKPHVDGYGLTVVRMGNFTVSIKDEDEATLKQLGQGHRLQQARRRLPAVRAGPGDARRGRGHGQGRRRAAARRSREQGWAWASGWRRPSSRGSSGRQQLAAPAPMAAAGTPCPNCGTPGTGKFCGNCGEPLAPVARKCTECGSDLGPGAKFCGSCGKPVTG